MITILGGFFLILVCLDMGIKQYVEDTYREREERETILGKVVFRKVYNKGFALNTLDDKPAIVKGASALAGIGVLICNIRLFLRKGKFFQKVAMTFVSVGAFSNIYDRLVRGKVIDYIGIRSKKKFLSRLTANLADIYLVVGVIILAFSGGFKKK